MDSSTKKLTSPSPSPSPNSIFSSFLWYFFQTLTLSSILLMVLSIYCAFASWNIRAILIITVAYAIICPTLIIPKLPVIAAASFPILELQKNFHIHMLMSFVWVSGFKYPFLIYFSCSSLMTGVGLLKLYGDGGPVCKRVINVIVNDALHSFVHMFGFLERLYASLGTQWIKSGPGAAFVGLIIMGIFAHYLPPLIEPEEKKMNATATMKEMNMAEALIPEVRNEDI